MNRTALLEAADLVADRVLRFDGERPFVATGDLDSEGNVTPVGVTFDGRPSRADLQVQSGDVCFARMKATNKVKGFGEKDKDLLLSTGFAVLRPRPGLSPDFLRHWLRSPEFQRAKDRLCTGAIQPAITNQKIAELEVPLPPLEEQKRIAAILDKADDLLAKRRAAIAHLDSLTQAIFIDMFGRVDSVDEPGRRVGIDDVCELIVDCVNRTAPTVEGPTPFKMIRTTNVRNGVVDTQNVRYVDQETFKRWNRRATPIEGDVLLTREAPVGEAGILRGAESVFLGQRLMLYRPDPSRITSEYLLECFRSPDMMRQFTRHGSGSTVKHLPLPACRSFTLHLAPLAEQRRFSKAVAVLDMSKSRAVAASEEAGTLQGSLQARAFRGEL